MENIFDTNILENGSFNESPSRQKIRSTDILTGSINTTQVDKYRQGVEITQQKHFDAGNLKISSGEIGHRSFRGNFGDNQQNLDSTSYYEPETISELFYDEKFIENGTIEPLTIRRVIQLKLNEKPTFHSTKSSFQMGNEDFIGGNDFVVNNFSRNEVNEFIPFIDDLDLRNYQNTAILLEKVSNLDPFDDKRSVKNDDGLTSDNLNTYVLNAKEDTLKEKFNSCGWDTENNIFGTDSIVYIGLKY